MSYRQQKRIGGLDLLSVHRGLRALLQRLAVPNHGFAAVIRKFKVLGEFESVHRAGIFAKSAEHAAAQIVSKIRQFFAARDFVTLARNDNQILRTGHRAKVARNAHRLIRVGIDIQPRRSAVALRNLGTLQRILLGIDFLGILIAEGDPHALHQVDQKDFAQQAWNTHDR